MHTNTFMNNSVNRTKVLYIIGEGRSGSTLLDMLVGQVEGLESVGELHYIWTRGLLDNQLCGCGEAFNSCQLWDAVISQFKNENDGLLLQELADFTSVDSMKKFPVNYLRDRFLSNNNIIKMFKSYDVLYESIANKTGSSIIIDSSKSIPFGYFLAKYSDLDIRFVHMVRDSRAVTFSRQKKKVRSEITEHVEYMPTVSSLKSSMKWLSNNLLASKVTHDRPCLKILYEDFVSDPQSTFNELAVFLDVPKERFGGLVSEDNMARMSVHHTVSGNPSRFKTGDIRISHDDRWKTEMLSRRKWLVTVLTWPLLRHYYKRRKETN